MLTLLVDANYNCFTALNVVRLQRAPKARRADTDRINVALSSTYASTVYASVLSSPVGILVLLCQRGIPKTVLDNV